MSPEYIININTVTVTAFAIEHICRNNISAYILILKSTYKFKYFIPTTDIIYYDTISSHYYYTDSAIQAFCTFAARRRTTRFLSSVMRARPFTTSERTG